MKKKVLIAAVGMTLAAVAKEPWRDNQVNEINRLPARMLVLPCESEEVALKIADHKAPIYSSKWIQSLNGEWEFAWKRSTAMQDWESHSKIAVPGCWQLQGEYDPPLYVNHDYPIAYSYDGDVTVEPPKNYTSYIFRNPVGKYTRTFRVPKSWHLRRTVLRFNGVSSAMEIRVNGKDVGYSEDSRLPAEFDISKYLKVFGNNTIEVTVYKHCDGTYIEDQDFNRLSGIFREVYLVSEAKSAPKDFIVETRLADDFSTGDFIIRDEKGGVLKERHVEKPMLWNPETPNLYITPMEHKWGWWKLGGVDHYAVSFGFRKIEVKDAVVYLNGKRLAVKGVNRHEMSPEKGYSVNSGMMWREASIIKRYNFNAVRTCHYPDDPLWYDVCDRIGIMLVAEANIEAHGTDKYYEDYLNHPIANGKEWEKSFVERGTRMVEFYRNHPSIIFWSLGNETGIGKNHMAEAAAMRAIDATRPVQYEGGSWKPGSKTDSHAGTTMNPSDITCPMYPSAKDCEEQYLKHPEIAIRPMILCEYAHAMGNSTGDFKAYWDLVGKYPSFQGGFIWDFKDQALFRKTKDGVKYLAYGGDNGDIPNNSNFNCNGVFDAELNPHPAANEIKYVQRPAAVKRFNWRTGLVEIENRQLFTDLTGVELVVVKYRDGAMIGEEKIELPEVGPSASHSFILGGLERVDNVVFRFVRDMCTIAWDSFARPFVPMTPPKALFDNDEETAGIIKYNFWRAPIDNERNKAHDAVKERGFWKDVTEKQKLPANVKSDLKISKGGTAVIVDWTITIPEGLPELPRVGLTMRIPQQAVDVPHYYGLGPWENYSDRVSSAILGVYELRDHCNYVKPSEYGHRTGVRWLTVGGKRFSALAAPFECNVWPHTQASLEAARHPYEIELDKGYWTISIDAAMRGVGGDDSWSAHSRPHKPYILGAGTYKLSFMIENMPEEKDMEVVE